MSRVATGLTNDGHDALTKHLRPTLLIGMGGSGKDVLLRIRRLFYERYGLRNKQLGYPIIANLVLDTDHGSFSRIEGETLSHFVLQNIEFNAGDMIGCQIQANEFNEYFDGGEQLYPHIFRWLDPGMRKYGAGAVANGAGQNRLLGRLAFFRHYRDIRRKLEAQLRNIIDWARDPELRRRWLPEDARVDASQLDVVLVYSLAGGTGAGMFMDMGILARKTVAELLPDTAAHFTHFALLPDAFVQAPRPEVRTVIEHERLQRKIQENAFGALREMEHFAMRRDQARFDLSIPPPISAHGASLPEARPLYVVQWDRNEEPYHVKDCPWDTCYVIGGRNDYMGQRCLAIGELYQMIAEQIFLDFEPSPFGNEKRSIRPNLLEQTLDYMKDEVKDEKGAVFYYRHLTRRFSTFGLSQIYFDRERMRRAASYRLAAALIRERWLREPLPPAELTAAAREDMLGGVGGLEQVVTDTHLPGDPRLAMTFRAVTRATLLLDDGGQKTYHDRIAEEAVQQEQLVRDGKYDPYNLTPFADWTEKHETLLRSTRTRTGETGLAVRSFNDRAKKLQKSVDDRAYCLFLYRLNAFGIRSCLQVFKEYATACEEQLALVREGEAGKEPRPPAKWKQEVEELGQRLKEAEGLPIGLYARRAVRWEEQRAREALRRAVTGHRNYLLQLYTYRALPDLGTILTRCQQRFAPTATEGSYLSALQRFNDALGDNKDGVLSFLDARFDELKSRRGDESRTIGLLADWDAPEYDQHMRRLLTANRTDERIDWEDVERQLLEHWRRLPNLPKTWKSVNNLGELVLALLPLDAAGPHTRSLYESLAQGLAEACEGLLGHFAADLSALKQFEKEKAENRRHALYQFRTHSAPYLRKNAGVDAHKVDTNIRICLGMSQTGTTEADDFRRDLDEAAKQSPLKLGDLNDKIFVMKDDAIVLYQEKAGIPICYEAGLDALGDFYDASDRIAETHIDYRNMRDVLPEVRLVDQGRQKLLAGCLENAIYAYVMGILRRQAERRDFRLALEQAGGGDLVQSVGTRLEEVATLCAGRRNDVLRTALKNRVDHWIDEATDQHPERLILLWCALRWAYEEILNRVQGLLDAQQRHAPSAVQPQSLRGAHPLVFILGSRMLPFVRDKVGKLEGGRWLESDYDLNWLLGNETEFNDEKRAEIRQRWRELLRGCYDFASDLPFPVIRQNARLAGAPTPNGAAERGPDARRERGYRETLPNDPGSEPH